MPYLSHCAILVLGVGLLAGCARNEPLPPVFNAVFGLSSAQSNAFALGKIDETEVGPDDSVVGTAANSPGSCIWQSRNGNRFRAACPEGYLTPR